MITEKEMFNIMLIAARERNVVINLLKFVPYICFQVFKSTELFITHFYVDGNFVWTLPNM